jgi:hypothetical protein
LRGDPAAANDEAAGVAVRRYRVNPRGEVAQVLRVLLRAAAASEKIQQRIEHLVEWRSLRNRTKFLSKHGLHKQIEGLRDVRASRADGRNLSMDVRLSGVDLLQRPVRTIERTVEGEELVEEQPECVNVGGEPGREQQQLLGASRSRSASKPADRIFIARPGEHSEIENNNVAARLEEYVVRLEVTVNELRLMEKEEHRRDAYTDP